MTGEIGEHDLLGDEEHEISTINEEPIVESAGRPVCISYAQFPLYEVKPSFGKGLGCFSTAHIPRGTRILSEQPLFAVLEPRANIDVTLAFDCCTAHQKELYRSLHCVDIDTANAAQVVCIFNGNCWQTESRSSIMLQASRFNHSCVPNASFAWNSVLGRITVHAIIDIPIDQEIMLNYELPYQTYLQRQTKLQSYGFACLCRACQPYTEFGIASEQRRSRMQVLDQRIRLYRRSSRKPLAAYVDKTALSASLEMIRLLKEEGLMSEALSLAYHDAATCFRRQGRRDLALRYALKEMETGLVCFGPDSPYMRLTEGFVDELRTELLSV